uniref:SFRICE_004210 n=1 Tax=Spodoptera frugiperda TaxID=7108 RepID=A0A2H1VHT2_SPOFR
MDIISIARILRQKYAADGIVLRIEENNAELQSVHIRITLQDDEAQYVYSRRGSKLALVDGYSFYRQETYPNMKPPGYVQPTTLEAAKLLCIYLKI